MGAPVDPTPTPGQGTRQRGRGGVVSGYVFRLVREHLGRTQESLSEAFGVSVDTVAGWESGRRPLTSLAVGQMLAHRHRLMRMGASTALLLVLEKALEADLLLANVLTDDGPTGDSPLGTWVLQRDLVEVLVWPLNGVAPEPMRAHVAVGRPRRGPSPDGPALSADDRRRFFRHIRRTAEEADPASPCSAARLSTWPVTTMPRTPPPGSRSSSGRSVRRTGSPAGWRRAPWQPSPPARATETVCGTSSPPRWTTRRARRPI